jgi:hypothetical protein
LQIGELGNFNFSYPVTTNVTPPFYLRVTGKAVAPRVRVRNTERKTVTELRFANGIWSSLVFLSNDGSAAIDIGNLNFADRIFKLEADCPPSLAPHTACPLAFSVNPRGATKPVEKMDWRIDAHGLTAVIVLTVVVGVDGMARIDKARAARKAAAVGALCGGVTLPICPFLWRTVATARGARKRGRLLRRAIERLSVSTRNSIGTEVVFRTHRVVGTWGHAQGVRPEVTAEVLGEMTLLLTP